MAALDLQFVHVDEPPPEEHVETLRSFLSFAAELIDKMLLQRGFHLGDLRVTVTEDVPTAVTSEVARLGLHPDQAGQLEPLGGLGGKTLVDDAWIPVGVIAGWSPASSPLSTMQVIAHELGHVLAITVGTALGAAFTDPATVAESDEAVALATADEYRADQFAAVLCAQGFTAADADGKPVDIWELRREHFLATLNELLDGVVPAVPDLIHAVRSGQADGEQVWFAARDRLHQAFNLLGYIEGTFAGDGRTIDASSHRAADLMRPLWEPLFAYLANSPILPGNAQWFDDDAEIRRIGREGIDAVYRSLGLTRIDSGTGGMSLQLSEPTWVP